MHPLVIIITGLNTGGTEMMLLKILEHIDRQRFSPHVISLTTIGELGPRIQALGIFVEALGMTPGFLSPCALWRLVRRLREIRPDMIHTMMYHANLLGGVAARLVGISALTWGIRHCNLSRQANKFTTLVVVAMGAIISRWVPKFILCCSEVARQIHVCHGYSPEKMAVIPNGFDISSFQPSTIAKVEVLRELSVDAGTQLVGLIGRFDVQKNHVGFFEAARLLHQRLPGVHFVLAGKGIDSENSRLMELMESAGVTKVTHLLGLRNDMPRLMAALDVLVSSSVGEAFPNVLGEAMACGVLCAVTDVGDSAYIVGDTGRVVASTDMEGLAMAAESLLLLTPDERRIRCERARLRVVDHFEIGAVVRMYEEFYLGSML